jgi:hypothetical protein
MATISENYKYFLRKAGLGLISRSLKTLKVLIDVDLLIKRCVSICKKVAICLQNLANIYVVSERKDSLATWFLQHL